MAEMELSANRLISQEALIKEIRSKIRRHVMETGCNDMNFEKKLWPYKDRNNMEWKILECKIIKEIIDYNL